MERCFNGAQDVDGRGFPRKDSRGAMNQLAFEYEVFIGMKEGWDHVKILEMNKDINRTILKGIKFLHPIEALREVLRISKKL